MYVGVAGGTKLASMTATLPMGLWPTVPDAKVKDVEHAIKSAHHAFESWSNLKFNERAHFMIKIAEVIEEKKMDIVKAFRARR